MTMTLAEKQQKRKRVYFASNLVEIMLFQLHHWH